MESREAPEMVELRTVAVRAGVPAQGVALAAKRPVTLIPVPRAGPVTLGDHVGRDELLALHAAAVEMRDQPSRQVVRAREHPARSLHRVVVLFEREASETLGRQGVRHGAIPAVGFGGVGRRAVHPERREDARGEEVLPPSEFVQPEAEDVVADVGVRERTARRVLAWGAARQERAYNLGCVLARVRRAEPNGVVVHAGRVRKQIANGHAVRLNGGVERHVREEVRECGVEGQRALAIQERREKRRERFGGGGDVERRVRRGAEARLAVGVAEAVLVHDLVASDDGDRQPGDGTDPHYAGDEGVGVAGEGGLGLRAGGGGEQGEEQEEAHRGSQRWNSQDRGD